MHHGTEGKDWVELEGLKPSLFMLKLLGTLESAGFKNVVLRGGALRDLYLGREAEIHDYDLIANFGPAVPKQGDDATLEADYRSFLQQVIPTIDKISRIDIDRDAIDGDVFLSHEFDFQGKRVSLAIDPRNESFETSALFADAPLNCIGMNADGKIIAHTQFENHAHASIYAPFNGMQQNRIAERFNHLSQKFPALTYGPPRERPVPPPSAIRGLKNRHADTKSPLKHADLHALAPSRIVLYCSAS